jgi:hypothetical protein
MKFLDDYLKTLDNDTQMEGSMTRSEEKNEKDKLIPGPETYRDCGEYCFEDFGM